MAERAGVETVVLGSFMKAGENIRINIRVQEAKSGKILTTEKVEGVGESSVFSMVDDLTRRVRARFDVPTAADRELDRGLKDVTTSSLEAYRHYAEGINLHNRFQEEEAIALFEKALQVDPGFAMALAKLSVIHSNLGHDRQAEDYGRRALEHVDRLSARERYYIQGNYYSRREQTYGSAIEAYRKAVELYPDHTAARNNLAFRCLLFERYEEAIKEGEELIRARTRARPSSSARFSWPGGLAAARSHMVFLGLGSSGRRSRRGGRHLFPPRHRERDRAARLAHPLCAEPLLPREDSGETRGNGEGARVLPPLRRLLEGGRP